MSNFNVTKPIDIRLDRTEIRRRTIQDTRILPLISAIEAELSDMLLLNFVSKPQVIRVQGSIRDDDASRICIIYEHAGWTSVSYNKVSYSSDKYVDFTFTY